ncbi:MAG: hypothetical protein ACR2PX_05045 [Endozoicomonas sp.]|uniref:hypothetical protein n=1 Tax=Endozoicomonas sp. TaxID=1892382 RepID=UPI003D9AE296
MLACYPISATQENWLHDALVSLVRAVHQRIIDNNPITKSQACWIDIMPSSLTDEQKIKIQRRTGIRDRLYDYSEKVKLLTSQERLDVLTALERQNQIPELLSNQLAPISIRQRFPLAHEKARDLFVFSYEKLTDFKIRERQYQIVFNSIDNKFCIFCGLERLMNPAETAQDQDHYLSKSEYPFSAVNMRNLVPMCRCCNRDFKEDKNLLLDEQSNLRPAFDPYGNVTIEVSLTSSSLDNQTSPPKPDWDIAFIPARPEIAAWDEVFSIRERYKRDALNQYFTTWLRVFTDKCARRRRDRDISPALDFEGVRGVLARYYEDQVEDHKVGVNFLEPYVFEFLLTKYDAEEPRVVNLIRDAVLGIDLEEIA